MRHLVMALRSGASRAETLRELGVSESTFYRELRRSPELRELVESEAPGAAAEPFKEQTPAPPVTPAAGSGSNGSGRPKGVKQGGSAQDNGTSVRTTGTDDVVTPPSPASARRPGTDEGDGRQDPAAPSGSEPTSSRPVRAERAAPPSPPADRRPKRRQARRVTPVLPSAASVADASATVVTLPEPAVEGSPISAASTALATTAASPGALVAAHAGRPAPSAPAGADWMPPVAVLTLQLVVAIAVGAHPLIILAVALATLGVLLGVRRARRVIPRRGSRAGIRYREVMVIPEGGPVGPADRASRSETGDPRGAEAEGRAADAHHSDLDWVAASILRVPTPDDPRPPRPRS